MGTVRAGTEAPCTAAIHPPDDMPFRRAGSRDGAANAGESTTGCPRVDSSPLQGGWQQAMAT